MVCLPPVCRCCGWKQDFSLPLCEFSFNAKLLRRRKEDLICCFPHLLESSQAAAREGLGHFESRFCSGWWVLPRSKSTCSLGESGQDLLELEAPPDLPETLPTAGCCECCCPRWLRCPCPGSPKCRPQHNLCLVTQDHQ